MNTKNSNIAAAPAAEHLLTLAQTAIRLGISERLVRRLAASGDLRTVRYGRRLVRVTPEAIAEWIARHSTGMERR